MKLQKLTTEEILNDSVRDYNPAEWTKIINRFASYGSTFYKLPAGNGYTYDRFYAVYTIPEGIKLLGSVSYSSCLSNCGFNAIAIDEEGYTTVVKVNADNTASNRKIMARQSKEIGSIWTTEF